MPEDAAPQDAHLGQLARHGIAIESATPEIDAGRFAAKRVEGRPVEIMAGIFGNGHEVIGADEGGFRDVHPSLGTIRDFDRLGGRPRATTGSRRGRWPQPAVPVRDPRHLPVLG